MLGSIGGGSVRGFGRGVGGGGPVGGVLFNTTGYRTWAVPAGVSEISIVSIGGGGGGSLDHDGSGGGGGGLGWKNAVSVTEGEILQIQVGAGGDKESTQGGNSTGNGYRGANGGNSWVARQAGTYIVRGFGGEGGPPGGDPSVTDGYGGSFLGDGGGVGGDGGTLSHYPVGGGGAGGYSGNGGAGSRNDNTNAPSGNGGGGGGGARANDGFNGPGGGVGIYGQGSNGAGANPQGRYSVDAMASSSRALEIAGSPGSGGAICDVIQNPNGYYMARGGVYGGGGGAGYNSSHNWSSKGGNGGVRIIWGAGRAFPSTNVDLASSIEGETTV